jgi:Potential Queuosine, Q, salvage protein family
VSATDDIRNACAAVARRARFVQIDEMAIERYALSLPLERAIAPAVDWATHFRGDEAETVAFFVVLDSINFGSGYFPHLRKRAGMSGYFTVASALKDEFERGGAISARRMAGITAEECGAVFGQDSMNGPAMELMGLFATALNDLGRLLLAKYGGDPCALIESARGSAEQLIDLLAEMPFFRDVSTYDGAPTSLYKRAQLLSADLSIALERRGLGAFSDLDRLTIFADNLVPHVLRVDAVLKYADGLAERIDREELIAAGSKEEVEIRACGLHAVEMIKAVLRRAGRPVTAMGLDYILWNRGQEKHYKGIKPRHRARSVYY